MIDYHGRAVKILDGKMLESTVCTCYPGTQRLLENLYKQLVVPEAVA